MSAPAPRCGGIGTFMPGPPHAPCTPRLAQKHTTGHRGAPTMHALRAQPMLRAQPPRHGGGAFDSDSFQCSQRQRRKAHPATKRVRWVGNTQHACTRCILGLFVPLSVLWLVVRGDAWPVLISPCNTRAPSAGASPRTSRASRMLRVQSHRRYMRYRALLVAVMCCSVRLCVMNSGMVASTRWCSLTTLTYIHFKACFHDDVLRPV